MRVDFELENRMMNKIPIKVKMTADVVGECMRTENQVGKMDLSLGKSVKIGLRNLPKEGDENLVFGLTTDHLNSMNDRSLELGKVAEVIGMSRECQGGFSRSEHEKQRSREEIIDILRAVGFEYKMGMFEGIWMKAAEFEWTDAIERMGRDTVSVGSLLKAIKVLEAMP